MEIGIDSFAASFPDPASGERLAPAVRMANLLGEVEAADRAGVDVFGIGDPDTVVDKIAAADAALGGVSRFTSR